MCAAGRHLQAQVQSVAARSTIERNQSVWCTLCRSVRASLSASSFGRTGASASANFPRFHLQISGWAA